MHTFPPGARVRYAPHILMRNNISQRSPIWRQRGTVIRSFAGAASIQWDDRELVELELTCQLAIAEPTWCSTCAGALCAEACGVCA